MSRFDSYEVVVVGGGHAGCEAALAAARLGSRTLLVTLDLDRIAWPSCNPAVGGLAKGHLTREIDSLGGAMGWCADQTGIQFRRLNLSKGPAVRATRAQIDGERYPRCMRALLEATPGLTLLADEATAVTLSGRQVEGIRLARSGAVAANAVVITTGTFLNGRLHIGSEQRDGGRIGDPPARSLSAWLAAAGIRLGRLKTGTPPRLHGRTLDLANLKVQRGDSPPPLFSWRSDRPPLPQRVCYETHTTAATHDLIRRHRDQLPLFSGQISGRGPRYCPSIEDKVFRFADRDHHQVYVEPLGLDSDLYYPNGISTSMPLALQEQMVRTIPGFERALIAVPAYAIEYDFVPPTQLDPTLQARTLPGLFFAGQINGTSGYEEAAGQGLLAGLNAARHARGEEAVTFGREEGYLGVMVDDLTTLGIDEPYRLFTSRAELRLSLSEASAATRLTPRGRALGLVGDDQWSAFQCRRQRFDRVMEELAEARVDADAATNDWLALFGSAPVRQRIPLIQLLTRPELNLAALERLRPGLTDGLGQDLTEEIETRVKFQGYLQREEAMASRMVRMEARRIPGDFDYRSLPGLTTEAAEKLERARPLSLGQAARIPGVTPAAIAAILVRLTG